MRYSGSRFGNVRGVPLLASVMSELRELDDLVTGRANRRCIDKVVIVFDSPGGYVHG